MRMIKVLLVEDDPSWTNIISEYLDKIFNISVIGNAENRERALHLLALVDVDVVVMDITLGSTSSEGINLIMEMMHIKRTHIIVLTSIQDEEAIIECFKLGAVNLIYKENYRDLPHAIREANLGRFPLHASAAQILISELIRLKKEQEKSILTKTEIEILRSLSEGLSQIDIENQFFISRNTVKNHVSNIIKKLNVTKTKEAIDIAKKKRWF